jgi:hypothetical protein
MELVFLSLVLLQIKHWYIDFVNQDEEEVKYKAEYMDWRGLKHSLKQGVGTALVLLICTVDPAWAWALGGIDFLLHYHIDWAKMNWGNRDIRTPQFWAHLGLDQMAHQLTYIGVVATLVL